MRSGKQKAGFVRGGKKGTSIALLWKWYCEILPSLIPHSLSKQKRIPKLTLSALRSLLLGLCLDIPPMSGGSSQFTAASLSMVRHRKEGFSYNLSRISWPNIQLWEFATPFHTLLLCLDNKSGFATPATFTAQFECIGIYSDNNQAAEIYRWSFLFISDYRLPHKPGLLMLHWT